MDHLRGHPVGVAHHGVPLPAVLLLQAGLQQLVLVLILHHEPGQAKVGHHHRVVLRSGERETVSVFRERRHAGAVTEVSIG